LVEKAEKKRIAPPGSLQFDRERAFGGVAAGEIESAAAQDGDVGGAIVLAVAGGIFPERNVKLPM
jgi:hypothetical protein